MRDIIDGIPVSEQDQTRLSKAAEQLAQYDASTPADWGRVVAKLEKQMYAHAKNLEFEQAGAVRDQIKHIRDQNLKGTYK